MPFLVLCPDMDVSPNLTLSENSSCYDMVWQTGHVIDTREKDLSRLEFVCESRHIIPFPDFSVADSGCLIVSNRLKEFLASSGIDNIEYFPATIIEYKASVPTSGFFAANIIGLTDCIDDDLSEFRARKKGGAISSIDKLILMNPFPDFGGYITRVFRFRRLVLINQVFKQKFDGNNFTGLKLIEPEKWDGFYGER